MALIRMPTAALPPAPPVASSRTCARAAVQSIVIDLLIEMVLVCGVDRQTIVSPAKAFERAKATLTQG